MVNRSQKYQNLQKSQESQELELEYDLERNLEHNLKHYKISQEDFVHICEGLGRKPQGLEWALFSALWSEHCSYKSSKIHLKKFFSQSERVIESFGENAGVIDLGQGERIAFKMESHNHPSYIEPTQGAATGVGGILRDIFTMGARPVALANYLCFGSPQAHRMSELIKGVVHGIGSYGNCVGVPTITGQTEFHSSYNGNILVNALAVGLFRPGEKIFTSQARGIGNSVVYVGAKTGRDGVHGASMASGSFDGDSEKTTVQIGDPFFEKLLIESCLEVMDQDLVVAIQDMGAAGLTSSSFEMASKGDVGLTLHLDRVPLRNTSITPEEILLSESQERMLLICESENVTKLQKVFEKWDLDAPVIGEVIEEEVVQIFWHGEKICQIGHDLLVKKSPTYKRDYQPWVPTNRVTSMEEFNRSFKKSFKKPMDTRTFLLSALSDERGMVRDWIYRQYDQRVGGATAGDCSESLGVLRLPDSGRGLGLVLGCRPYMMRFDASEGGKDAIAYPAIELAAKGFEPLAVTDCLNFGNPEKPEVMSEFVAAVESMSRMCESLQTPVISGNVSFYNETFGKNVTSTPSTGVVGLRSDVVNIPSSYFQNEGDQLFLLSSRQLHISGLFFERDDSGKNHAGKRILEKDGSGKEISDKEILEKDPFEKYNKIVGRGELDPPQTSRFVKSLLHLVQNSPVQSSRIVGKFGLAYTLARMSTVHLGCDVPTDPEGRDWFTENLYEVIISLSPSDTHTFLSKAHDLTEIKVETLGSVIRGQLKLGSIHLSCQEVQRAYGGSWGEHFHNLGRIL